MKFKYFAAAFFIGILVVSTASAASIKNKRPAGFKFDTKTILQEGSENTEVKNLQILLNSNPETTVSASGAGSPGNETEYFGGKTKTAVIKFGQYYKSNLSSLDQSQYRNPGLSGNPGMAPQGVVDELAKRFMNSLPEIQSAGSPAENQQASSSNQTPIGGGSSPGAMPSESGNTVAQAAKQMATSFGGIISGTQICNCSAGIMIMIAGPTGGNFIVLPGKTKMYGGSSLAGPVLGKYKPGGSCSYGSSGCSSDDPVSVVKVKGVAESLSAMMTGVR